jgi:hypothetical protein
VAEGLILGGRGNGRSIWSLSASHVLSALSSQNLSARHNFFAQHEAGAREDDFRKTFLFGNSFVLKGKK